MQWKSFLKLLGANSKEEAIVSKSISGVEVHANTETKCLHIWNEKENQKLKKLATIYYTLRKIMWKTQEATIGTILTVENRG